ncbi:sensor histidine kinase [Kitasatospora terrestris]|uniref:Oxygen sensor histidine kinase NreB n=1 Tax=Kitasatospora terrestris TaxID=258051 RepID=A0ABP9DLN3_9ACTN
MRRPLPQAVDPDAGWLAAVMRLAFLLLLGTALLRYLDHHLHSALTPWVIGLSIALGITHLRGRAERRPAWLAVLLALWVVLVLMAPSFAWCAIPLLYTVLRALPAKAAIALVSVLTALVVVAELRLADSFDPTLPLLPPAVAALATAVFLHMERQGARQRALIIDLISTRRELAATERREGALAERERLAVEIHDSLAQGLSSQQMLLQAADRTWENDPGTARTHVRTANSIAARNLAEARRFVHDLAPADLADLGTLDAALRALAEREAAESGLPVRFHLDGTPVPMPTTAEAALLRIAQGALANIREHSDASAAAITLSYLGDQAVLDVVDDGRGFSPDQTSGSPTSSSSAARDLRHRGGSGRSPRFSGSSRSARSSGRSDDSLDPSDSGSNGPDGRRAPTRARREQNSRGHGLPAMRARLRQLGGSLTIESVQGEGTVVSASIPLDPRPGIDPRHIAHPTAPTTLERR